MDFILETFLAYSEQIHLHIHFGNVPKTSCLKTNILKKFEA